MATGTIHAGICGFIINVNAVSNKDLIVKLEITCDCPNYQKISQELKEVNAYKELFNKPHLGRVYEVFAKHSPHPSCPGVAGILKTVEVAAGLALPQTVAMTITKD